MKIELRAIPSPEPGLTRRAPDIALPPYRYVPGLNPHPFRHADGHMYVDGTAPAETCWVPAAHWRQDIRFLYAADLFDHRFYWEAHEAWEAMWHFAEEGTPIRDLLQSLIQCAASILQHHIGRQAGSERLLKRASSRMQCWTKQGQTCVYGVEFEAFLRSTRAHIEGGSWPILCLELS